MGIRLIEIKTDESHKEFMVQESVGEEIVNWECIPLIEEAKAYLKKHNYPEDKLYPQKDFLSDVEKAGGYIHLWVEKEETAQFIVDLMYELI